MKKILIACMVIAMSSIATPSFAAEDLFFTTSEFASGSLLAATSIGLTKMTPWLHAAGESAGLALATDAATFVSLSMIGLPAGLMIGNSLVNADANLFNSKGMTYLMDGIERSVAVATDMKKFVKDELATPASQQSTPQQERTAAGAADLL